MFFHRRKKKIEQLYFYTLLLYNIRRLGKFFDVFFFYAFINVFIHFVIEINALKKKTAKTFQVS